MFHHLATLSLHFLRKAHSPVSCLCNRSSISRADKASESTPISGGPGTEAPGRRDAGTCPAVPAAVGMPRLGAPLDSASELSSVSADCEAEENR